MLTNLQSPYIAEIFTDQPFYEPGSKVTGQVILTLKRKLRLDRLVANLRGEVKISFEIKPPVKKNREYYSANLDPEPIKYTNNRQLVNQSVVLWSQVDAVRNVIRRSSKTSADSELECQWGLEAGTHTFNVCFQLPNNGLYTSFDAKNSPTSVRYVIEARTQYGSAEIIRGESLIAIVCPQILTLDKYGNRQSFVQTKQLSKNEQLAVQLTLNKTKFIPGDPIQGEVVIHNKTKQSIKFGLLKICHKLSCFSDTPNIYRYDHEINQNGMGLGADKVCSGQSFAYPIQLNIPVLVPQLNIPNCLFTSYEIQLSVGFVRNSPNAAVMSLNVPIEIGTQLIESSITSFESAPPAYDEIITH